MKYIIYTILAFLLFFSCSSYGQLDNNIKKKKVFLFAGQSNMDGRGNGAELSETDLERLSSVANRFEFYYNHQPVSPLQLTTPAQHIQEKFKLSQCFGPELFFGIELAERYPDDEFIFIKRSKGGVSLYGCWNPYWTKEKASHMDELDQPKLFVDFKEFVQNTLESYDSSEYEICGMLWVQGETDSSVKKWGEEPSNTYGQNLWNLIEQTRTILSMPQLPFVMFQVGGGNVVKGMKQVANSDENVYLIPQSRNKDSIDFYEKNPPPIGHYIAKSMKKLGVEFFKTYETILNKY